jgi:sulfatase modifying factor 1
VSVIIVSKEIDSRKLNFEYYWIDLVWLQPRKTISRDRDPASGSLANRPQGRTDRSVYIKKEIINVYPDTLSWIHDYTYSFNDPITKAYFWHPAYDDYPVVGVNWLQAKGFCVWRTQLALNSYMES